MSAAVALLLLVGGTALAFAARIYFKNEAIAREYAYILRLDQVHSTFDDLIFELQQVNGSGRSEDRANLLLLADEVRRSLDGVGGPGEDDVNVTEQARDVAAIRTLRLIEQQGRALAVRMTQTAAHLSATDREWLRRATFDVPQHVSELAQGHEDRITRTLDGIRALIEALAALFVSVLVGGAGVIAAVGTAANRAITAPLRRLAAFAKAVGEGEFESRVQVHSANELGLVSYTLNSMAERLQHQMRDLRGARDMLQAKVHESEALYRIATEIARLQQPDLILDAVVESARDLLRADAAIVRLVDVSTERVLASARSGPADAFLAPDEAAPWMPVAGDVAERCAAASPVFRPEYARAWVAAPLRIGTEDIGTIHVGFLEPRDLSEEDSELLSALAMQAAIAIKRAWLSNEVRSLAAVEERERLARELHDGLAQALGLLHMKLAGTLSRTLEPGAVADELRDMLRITDRAYEEVRQAMFGLRVFVSRGLGLLPTLTEYLHEFSESSGVSVNLETDGVPLGKIAPAAEVQVVRIIQEALSNVWKHAGTDRARVRLDYDGHWLRVSVEDDGAGWDGASAPSTRHFGLDAMRERAEGVGGRLQVDTAPGHGTRVTAMIPGGVA